VGLIETQEQQLKELSAREIFNRIVKGQVVRIPNDPVLAAQLKNHLSVIKHREKKLFKSLGLDWISAVIVFWDVKSITDEILAIDISLTAPKTRRKYPAFALVTSRPEAIICDDVVENKDNAASPSTT